LLVSVHLYVLINKIKEPQLNDIVIIKIENNVNIHNLKSYLLVQEKSFYNSINYWIQYIKNKLNIKLSLLYIKRLIWKPNSFIVINNNIIYYCNLNEIKNSDLWNQINNYEIDELNWEELIKKGISCESKIDKYYQNRYLDFNYFILETWYLVFWDNRKFSVDSSKLFLNNYLSLKDWKIIHEWYKNRLYEVKPTQYEWTVIKIIEKYQ